MTNKNFKLFCKELDEIISVKTFSQETEAKIYDKLKTYLNNATHSFNVLMYKKKVVDSLLLDASSYYSIEMLR